MDQVLRLKQQRLKLEELGQQQAQAACEKARSEVVAVKNQLTQAAIAHGVRANQGNLAVLWLAQSRYVARLEQALSVAEANLLKAEQALREAAARRTAAAKEVETLLTLLERERKEYRARSSSAGTDRVGWSWPAPLDEGSCCR